MKKRLKISVIGCGGMGMEHIANLLASGYCEAENISVFDVNAQSQSRAQSQYGVRIATDLEALLSDLDTDAIVIACSNRFHSEMAIRALRHGKHVLLEKPMALNEADAREVVRAARESGRILHVGFELRNSQFPRMVKKMREELGELISGQVIEYRGHFWPEWKGKRSDGGSMFLMETCHIIDLFRWITESEVAEIHAIGSERNLIPHYEYPDTQFTSLVFKNGFVGHITLCHTRSAMPSEFSYADPTTASRMLDEEFGHQYEYTLVGKKGSLRFLPLKGVCYYYRNEVQPDGSLWPRLEHSPACAEISDHKSAIHNVHEEMSEFLEAVANGGAGSLDPEDALETHLVCFAAENALRQRKPVTLREVAVSDFRPLVPDLPPGHRAEPHAIAAC